MKFRITEKVSSFLHEGKRYSPGDIVDLRPRYRSLNWLEPVKKSKPAAKQKPEPKPQQQETSEVQTSEVEGSETKPSEKKSFHSKEKK